MKKLIGILTALTLLFLLVGCSSKSNNKYDEEINKILEYKKLDRKEVNIQVYDNVNIDTQKVKGNFTVYRILYYDKITYSNMYIFSKSNNEILKLPYEISKQIENSNKFVFEEKNNDKITK